MEAIGIDLGTTNSVAAIHDEHGAHVLLTSMREPLTPSVVSYRDGKLLVGRSAWNNAVRAPNDTIFSIKRLMGRSIDDPTVIQIRKHYPYDIVAADNLGDLGVRVVVNKVKRTPIDISAMILRQIVEDTSTALGEQVTHAVITVPANFAEPQRAATRKAGKQAGLIVKKMIDEPTAAAIAFGMRRDDKAHSLLVFDLGGGTLDVSILRIKKRQFVVMASVGDMWLGGDDFDREIVKMIIEWVKQRHNVDPSNDKRFLMMAKHSAEEAKRYLTAQPEADVLIPAISLAGGKVIEVDTVIGRDEFERKIAPYVDKCVNVVKRVMDKQSLSPEDISTVLMVGGSTAVPLIHQTMVRMFGKGKVKHHVDPMQVVALGAATLAAEMEGVECPACETVNPDEAEQCKKCGASLTAARAVGGVELDEVTSLDLGIGAVDEEGTPDVFSVIIPADTPYPLEEPMERLFVTTSHAITVPVYEGDKPLISQNQYMGLVEHQLPDDVPPKAQVVVQFNYDRDRVLTVRLKVPGRPELDREATLVRDTVYVPPPTDDAGWHRPLQNAIATTEAVLKDYREFINPGQQQSLKENLERARSALNDRDEVKGRKITADLSEALINLGTATYLFLAERMMYDVEPKGAEALAQASKSLREAHTKGDEHRMDQIKQVLEMTINQVSKRRASGAKLRDFGGLLRNLKKPEDG